MYTFHNICRTCSCQGELRSLFVADPLILANMLTEVVDLKVVKGDKFPQNICTFCLEKLKSAYLFKKQCQAIQIKLDLYLQSIADTPYNVVYKEEVSAVPGVVVPVPQNNQHFDAQQAGSISSATGDEPNGNQIEILDSMEESLKEEENGGTNSNNWNDDDNEWGDGIGDDMDRRSTETPSIEPDINIFTSPQPPSEQTATVKERKKNKKRARTSKGAVRKKVECNECHKKVNDLELHMKIHLNIPYKCEICGAEMLRKNYSRHLKVHKNERPIPCTLCPRHFRDNYTLRLHMRTHSGDRPYKCTMCERAFKLRFQLTNHLNKHYAGEIKDPVKEEIPENEIQKMDVVIADVECDECNEKFTTKLGLSRHKSLTHGSGGSSGSCLCNFCGKLLASKLSLKQHQHHCSIKKDIDTKDDNKIGGVDNESKEFECETCNKKYVSKDALSRHKTTHRKKPPHLCTLCGKLFSSKVTLKGHQLIHLGRKPYKCNVCNQNFRHKQHLSDHRRIHTGEKPFKCTLCDKAYSLKKILTVHMRIHTGENPYTCPYCSKGFYDLSNYKRHVASHKTNHTNMSKKMNLNTNYNQYNHHQITNYQNNHNQVVTVTQTLPTNPMPFNHQV